MAATAITGGSGGGAAGLGGAVYDDGGSFTPTGSRLPTTSLVVDNGAMPWASAA